jgi:hypothetical protein
VVEAVTEDGIESRFKLCVEFLNFMGKDDLLYHVVFSDEAVFHILRCVNAGDGKSSHHG